MPFNYFGNNGHSYFTAENEGDTCCGWRSEAGKSSALCGTGLCTNKPRAVSDWDTDESNSINAHSSSDKNLKFSQPETKDRSTYNHGFSSDKDQNIVGTQA